MARNPFSSRIKGFLGSVWAVGLAAGLCVAQPTTRVSVDTDGKEASKVSLAPGISADGRFVVFASSAENLAAGGTGGKLQVFVHDRVAGETTRISSKTGDATKPGDGDSRYPSVSVDGRYVVFHSDATDLVAGDTNGMTDVFLYDRQSKTMTMVSVKQGGGATDGRSLYATMSRDATLVAFSSRAKNMVDPAFGNGKLQVFVWERATGKVAVASAATDAKPADLDCFYPFIAHDGGFVAFESAATNLTAGDTNARSDIFLRDLTANTTAMMSVGHGGAKSDGDSGSPVVSRDGKVVAFQTKAGNLVNPGDGNGKLDIYLRDTGAGTTRLVSVKAGGGFPNGDSTSPSISLDARFIAFDSTAADLTDEPTNGRQQIFLRDVGAGATQIVSLISDNGSDGDVEFEGNGDSSRPDISGDGAFVAFVSKADNLVGARDSGGPRDGNGLADVFVRDIDDDKDGLPNVWETAAIDIDYDRTADLDLKALGAKPDHKDIFLEIDAMTSHKPEAGVITDVVNAFGAAPNTLVKNPDGANGVRLVAALDEGDIADADWDSTSGDAWTSFNTAKGSKFGTAAQRADGNKAMILRAKARTYRYCIFAKQILSNSTSGIAELPGNDCMVTLGHTDWGTPTRQQKAGTLMHEFGHTLGLQHGGGDSNHFKPNYHSVMNYSWQMPAQTGAFGADPKRAKYVTSWRLDYSQRAFRRLDETKLNEKFGMNGDPNVFVPIGPPIGTGRYGKIVPERGPVDFDRDGKADKADAGADVNKPTTSASGTGTDLVPHEDWSKLRYALYGATRVITANNSKDYSDRPFQPAEDPLQCITAEQYEDINLAGWCMADHNADGLLDTQDMIDFLNDWNLRYVGTDFNEDSRVDTRDVLAFLNAWNGGCTLP